MRRNKTNKSIAWALIFAAIVAGAIYIRKPHRTFDIVVGDNIVLSLSGLGENELYSTPDRFRVNQGDLVTVRVVIIDEDNELYIHGYEKRLPLEVGRQVEVSFVADIPGTFQIELERTKIDLGVIEVFTSSF